ncbi:NHLP leader peptide family RiPP precursor [Nitrospirillum sp. BR 11163]|uniref:NHLP leader peptide family RiPP precursor n=1 Tax=Nitrospirillum sp. BR 11163 TaxID=3104323 RepID=UPI002AFF1830|nr:NHLP leader peptide family RiPP precursor [Nitrospirillum sp. BR 11163]MEA1671865.1 NHLP leader peptide family RiPP precursor [Nitrospirillum sp. BR 11163]
MQTDDNAKAYGKIVAKAWSDDTYKARLLADPAAVLAAEGVALPTGVAFRVVENTDTAYTLVLPAKPTDISDTDLDAVAGGRFAFSCGGPAVVKPKPPGNPTRRCI